MEAINYTGDTADQITFIYYTLQLLKMCCDHTSVNYVSRYMIRVFLALYSMSKSSSSTLHSLLNQGKGKGTYGSKVQCGYTLLYKFIRTVSWERSWLSNTHFMWPCVPGKIKHGSQTSQTTDINYSMYRYMFGFQILPHLKPLWCGLCNPT